MKHIFTIIFTICQSICFCQIISSHECDSTIADLDNIRSDTSKVFAMDSGLADTTMKMLHGYVFDFENKPIQNATIVLRDNNQKFSASTNGEGYFEIHQFFEIHPSWNLSITKSGYHCLNINHIMYVNYEVFRIRLRDDK